MTDPPPIAPPDRLSAIEGHLAALAGSMARASAALERIADALDRGGLAAPAPAPADPLDAVRSAIGEGRWLDADRDLADLESIDPEGPGLPPLRLRVDRGRAEAADAARARLDSARSAGDPAQIVEARDALVDLLPAAGRSALDAEVVKGLMLLLQRRLRAGKIGPDVAELAAIMADRFASTAEGASLRAALPTLRRSAGLCPRCARPYRGIEAACPACTGGVPESDERIEGGGT